jgi:mannan endo-1,4-beta-mannosidase
MKAKRIIVTLCAAAWIVRSAAVFCAEGAFKPATPHASPEAAALLKFLYGISGKYTLTGQHNYPNIKDRNSRFAAEYTGKTPAVFSTDWGHAKAGDTDSYLARPDIVEEAVRQQGLGSIITICWHAAPPTADEPVTFRPVPGNSAPEPLASVQGRLLDAQFADVLTPGTALYKRWCRQVDSVAVYLKKLQAARVPVLWRPYHEMNGGWFWWGGRTGRFSTAALYRQLFDRLVKHHRLRNLVWVWSVDRPNRPEMRFQNYYPGDRYVDVLSLDVYGGDFNRSYYDTLAALSKGRPIALAEVGNPPTPEILAGQPRWTFYVTWAGMVRNTTKRQYDALVHDPRVLGLEDKDYRQSIAPLRAACGLPSLPDPGTRSDFSGEWIFNEERSELDNTGAGSQPFRMTITRKENELTVRKTIIVEYADDKIVEEKWIPGGGEVKSEFWGSPRTARAFWSDKGDTLHFDSKITFNRGGQSPEMEAKEAWSLRDNGRTLIIKQSSNSFWGKRNLTLVYDRR